MAHCGGPSFVHETYQSCDVRARGVGAGKKSIGYFAETLHSIATIYNIIKYCRAAVAMLPVFDVYYILFGWQRLLFAYPTRRITPVRRTHIPI